MHLPKNWFGTRLTEETVATQRKAETETAAYGDAALFRRSLRSLADKLEELSRAEVKAPVSVTARNATPSRGSKVKREQCERA